MPKRRRYEDDGNNKDIYAVSLRSIVNDAQFRSGYRDRLAGLPPRRFYCDERRATGDSAWGYERGRLLACWILTTDVPPPAATDVDRLMWLYRAAEDADVML
jgi:hypothetical protein